MTRSWTHRAACPGRNGSWAASSTSSTTASTGIWRPQKRDRTALIWEGDGGEVRRYTYAGMNAQVCRLANAMRAMGMRPGDSAGIFMPMLPETVFAMFACLKVGVVAIPIFSGFGPEAVAERLEHADARLVFTSNGGMRRGKEVGVKALMDKALELGTRVEKVVVFKRTETEVPMQAGRDVDWEDFIEGQPEEAETERLPAEAHSLIIYTSGTTGKPKGSVHTHAGCMLNVAKEIRYCMDLRDSDVLFWVTDIGWMNGPLEDDRRPVRGRHVSDLRGRAQLARAGQALGRC